MPNNADIERKANSEFNERLHKGYANQRNKLTTRDLFTHKTKEDDNGASPTNAPTERNSK